MKSAEEVARQIVPDPVPSNDWPLRSKMVVRAEAEEIVLAFAMDGEIDNRVRLLRMAVARLIERSRAEGAAAERERLRKLCGERGEGAAVIAAPAADLIAGGEI